MDATGVGDGISFPRFFNAVENQKWVPISGFDMRTKIRSPYLGPLASGLIARALRLKGLGFGSLPILTGHDVPKAMCLRTVWGSLGERAISTGDNGSGLRGEKPTDRRFA